MKRYFFLLIFSAIILGCSNDSGDDLSQDSRYKLIFNFNGSGAIIGDKSNKLIKRIHTDIPVPIMTFNFSFNPNSNNFYFPAKSSNSNETVLHRANALSILNSDEYYYQTEEISVVSGQEQFSRAYVSWAEDLFVIYRNPSNSNPFLKKLNNGQLEYILSLGDLYQIAGNYNAFHLASINKLVLVSEGFNVINGVVLDLANKNNAQQFTLPGFINLFNVINEGNAIYFVHVNHPVDSFYDIDGNLVSGVVGSIGRSALGYDVKDARAEYVERGDGRNEAGIINISEGKLEFKGIAGDPGFHDSRLFFFDK